jgi:hypothetical protein
MRASFLPEIYLSIYLSVWRTAQLAHARRERLASASAQYREVTHYDEAVVPHLFRHVHIHGLVKTNGVETNGHEIEPILEQGQA